MNPNFADGMQKIKDDLLKNQGQLMKTLEALTKGDFKEKLREAMYSENKESEKRVKIKNKNANCVLMKTGEIVFVMDNSAEAKEIYESFN